MGCKAITPHLVSLARRLEGKPFHLVAAHCQRNPKAEVVAYLKSKGLAPNAPNVSVTSFGGHPEVKGNGYVPYYMVFDHHGKLVQHHMCGAYHGGDGLKMIDWVDKLLAKAPEIYLGKKPFKSVAKLATQISRRKNIASAIKKAEAALATAQDAGEKEELERLIDGVTRFRDSQLSRAHGLLASDPARAIPALKTLEKEFKGTGLAGTITRMKDDLQGSSDLKNAIQIASRFNKIKKGIEKLKGCKSCKRRGLKTLQPSCKFCRVAHKTSLSKAVAKLEALIAENDALPISKTVSAYVDELR